MSVIWRPGGKRVEQPQGRVALENAFLGGRGFACQVGTQVFSSSSLYRGIDYGLLINQTATSYGMGIQTDSEAAAIQWREGDDIDFRPFEFDATVIWLRKINVAVAFKGFWSAGTTNADHRGWHSTATTEGPGGTGSAWNLSGSDDSAFFPETTSVVVFDRTNSVYRRYQDGSLEKTLGYTPSFVTPTRLRVGSRVAQTGRFIDCSFSLFLYLDYALDSATAESVSANPWQVFKTDRPRTIFLPVAGVGFQAAWARGSNQIIGGGNP